MTKVVISLKEMEMSEPLFVAISDIHFNPNNLELATLALQAAIDKASELRIPLIIAGDLHDTKAIIRAEVANRLLKIFNPEVRTYILAGNHDLINEKGTEHGLNYLNSDMVHVAGFPATVDIGGHPVYLIPYQNTTQKFKDALSSVPKGSIVVCHQGVHGAYLGDYVQDKTSIEVGSLDGYKIISGHYHRHQTVGALTYIGSPFSHTFGEANDGGKGFLIVNEDGTYTQQVLPLRKHIKIEVTMEGSQLWLPHGLSPDDLVWLKITGPQSELDKLGKFEIGMGLLGHSNFKLDLIPTNSTQSEPAGVVVNLSAGEMLDKLIDSMPDAPDQLTYLKSLWKGLIT